MSTATEPKRTPLYEAHLESGAKIVPFSGWEMPVHYGSQIEEHKATREAAGIFDVSHMGQVEIAGPHALELVQQIITQDASKLGDGEEVYTVMCREDGGMVDDLIVTRFGPEEYFMVINAGAYDEDVEHLKAIARKLDLPATTLRPCTEEWAMIALQGPAWVEKLEKVIGAGDWSGLPKFRAIKSKYENRDLIISTTGYTGETGCELICRPEIAVALWKGLEGAGARPVGLAARDSLRLEKGLCLSGQDFTEANNPYEASLGWVVKLDKTAFSGKEVLEQVKAEGPAKRLMGFLPTGRRIPRHGAVIRVGGEAVGEITSGGFSPCLGGPIAMGYVKSEFAKKGIEVDIELGNGTTTAVITRPPFYPAKT